MATADAAAVAEGCWFDLAAAERVRDFFRLFLRHSKGQFAGKPFELLDWQWEGVIKPLFGWRRPDGTRRFRRAYVEIPKKNGKSTLAAGVALYLLCKDGEPGAEVYSAAATRDQASIVWQQAAEMVRASPALVTRCELKPSGKRIAFGDCRYQAISADAPSQEGLNLSGLIMDEVHAQPNRKLYETLKYGGAARRQPLYFAITTAGWDRTSLCYEMHTYAKAILDGRITDSSYFAFVAAALEEDDWKSPDTWRRANPSYGATLSEASFEEDFREALNSPASESAFKRYHLNIWTDSEVRWLDPEKWDACGKDAVDPESLKGEECYAGLDLSSTTDLSALVLYYPRTRSVLPFLWVPKSAVTARAKAGKARVDPWVRSGHVFVTDGDVIDYEHIRAHLLQLWGRYDVRAVAVDRWNSTQLQTQLQGDGFNVVQFGQGFASMTAPTKELERLVIKQELRHGGHPVLRWMASICTVEMDASGNLKPSKKKSSDRIDGVVALIMAIGQALIAEDMTPKVEVIR